MSMATLRTSEVREGFANAMDLAQTEPVFIERHGKPRAVLISIEVWEKLHDAWEELQDIAEAQEALDEPGESVPWEVLRAELGWD